MFWQLRVKGMGFRVSGLRFRVTDLGLLRVWGLGFRVSHTYPNSMPRVQGFSLFFRVGKPHFNQTPTPNTLTLKA